MKLDIGIGDGIAIITSAIAIFQSAIIFIQHNIYKKSIDRIVEIIVNQKEISGRILENEKKIITKDEVEQMVENVILKHQIDCTAKTHRK